MGVTAAAYLVAIVEELFSPLLGTRLRCGMLQVLADLQADFDGRKLAEALAAARTSLSIASAVAAG